MPAPINVTNNELSIEATVQFEGEAVQQLGTLGGFADSQQVVTVTPADISPPESQYIGLDGAEIEFNTPDLTTPLAVRFHPFSLSLIHISEPTRPY